MSLIPGELPAGTCYGTPQELLDLFAQYLTIPGYFGSRVAQTLVYEDGAVATGTTTMPIGSNPTITAGTQFMSFAVTPTRETSKLIIDVNFLGSTSATDSLGVGLYRVGTTDAVAVSSSYSVLNTVTNVSFGTINTSGTIAPITYTVRAGTSSAATTRFNSIDGTNPLYAGFAKSRIRVIEVLV